MKLALGMLPALAACLSMPPRPGGGSGNPDGGGGIDTPGPFACAGNSAPTTADPSVVLSGMATKVVAMSIDPAAGVTIEVRAGATVLGTVGPTAADGQFTSAVNTGGPLDGALYATIARPGPSDRRCGTRHSRGSGTRAASRCC